MKVHLYPTKYINGVVSHQQEVKDAVWEHSARIVSRAEAGVEAARQQGNLQVNVYEEDTDIVIELMDKPGAQDTNAGYYADVLAIEFGGYHYLDENGQYLKRGDPRIRKVVWQPGKYILYTAAGLV